MIFIAKKVHPLVCVYRWMHFFFYFSDNVTNLMTLGVSGRYGQAFFASPSGKMILFTKKNTTMEMPPLRTVVPML